MSTLPLSQGGRVPLRNVFFDKKWLYNRTGGVVVCLCKDANRASAKTWEFVLPSTPIVDRVDLVAFVTKVNYTWRQAKVPVIMALSWNIVSIVAQSDFSLDECTVFGLDDDDDESFVIVDPDTHDTSGSYLLAVVPECERTHTDGPVVVPDPEPPVVVVSDKDDKKKDHSWLITSAVAVAAFISGCVVGQATAKDEDSPTDD